MGTNAAVRIFVLALSLLAVGCGSEGGSQTKRVVPGDIYSKGACLELPETGEQAVLSNASRDDIRTANYFGKKYDAADLEAVYNASVISTSDYVKRIGIGLYKIPRTQLQNGKKLCQMYHFLNEPNEELKDLWRTVAGGNHGEGALAGLYFENCSIATCPERSLKDPTILVDEASDRWTLVHEMMHHNFNKTRKADPSSKPRRRLDAEMDYSFERFKHAMRKYEANPNRYDLMEAARHVDAVTKSLYDSLVRSSLEEITIESMLIDDYVDQKLNYVPHEAAYSASWYIEYSRDKSLERLSQVDRELIGNLLMEAESFSWDDVRDQLKTSREFIRGVRQETAEMVNRACEKSRRPNCQMVTNPRLQGITAAMVAMTHPHAEHVDEQGPGLKTFDKEMAQLSEKFGH